MRLLTIAAIFSSLFCFQMSDCDQATAQQVRNNHGDAVVNYQPSDPWKRSRWFNLQTGNSGLFYNCDGEQAKRNSPYICWKPDDEKMLPTIHAPWTTLKQQMDQVRQRINDGSCCSLGCSCADCLNAGHNCQQSGCTQCAQAPANHRHPGYAGSVQSTIVKSASIKPVVVDPRHGSKFGLVQGNRIEPSMPQQVDAPVVRSASQRSVANKSLLDQLRSLKQR